MRYAGLSLCLLVSTLTARAEALEERVASLEQTIRSLQEALQEQAALSGQPADLVEAGVPSPSSSEE